MNRRTAALTALAALAVLNGGTPALAQATPEASPAASPDTEDDGSGGEFLRAAEGRVLYASRDYAAGGFGIGLLSVAASVATFETEADALAAFERAGGLLDAIAAAEGIAVADRAEVSPPDVGERRRAERASVTEPDETAVEGRTLHVWVGFGLSDPALDLATLAGEAMRFGDLDADAPDADVLALLPALDEMPPGFTVDAATVTR